MDRITSVKNPTVQRLRSLKDRKGRVETGLFLVEGVVMIEEAKKCGLVMREMLSEEPKDGAIWVTREVMQAVCDTKSPQGVCAAFEMPDRSRAPLGDRLVALDGVQDPGNVGTILRTADAAGLTGALLGDGCADAYSPKVMRSAMGSGFRLPFIAVSPLSETLRTLKEAGYAIYVSSLQGEDFYSRRRPENGKFVLVIGSEAHGVSEEVASTATDLVKLPMRGGAESLNAAVAAGIMMYEIMRETAE